ncbi:hypothetical protein TUM19329_26250 [Legionella antarctica]|uniref:Uncharacterized protein n=1 Tax=Legionella antarctica TaxID=2708020 RepID=A0A6F8T6F2_9GAMM|nr:hypothetical protein [Legionella antarctica]BCA96264.1 hypothetical protein TUM19329_26250 [Legionella antarctica]
MNIKIAGNPFDSKINRYVMAEMHFKFKENDSLDMLIIKVTNADECDQLLKVAGSVWELNKKIIVVCPDEAAFLNLLESRLYFVSDKERLRARLGMMLLTPSILKALPASTILPSVTSPTNNPVSVIPASIFNQLKTSVDANSPEEKKDFQSGRSSVDKKPRSKTLSEKSVASPTRF